MLLTIIFTTLTGLVGMLVPIRLSRHRRLKTIKPLDLDSAFKLGIHSLEPRTEEAFDGIEHLQVYDRRVEPKGKRVHT
jgi:hypothetical protein